MSTKNQHICSLRNKKNLNIYTQPIENASSILDIQISCDTDHGSPEGMPPPPPVHTEIFSFYHENVCYVYSLEPATLMSTANMALF